MHLNKTSEDKTQFCSKFSTKNSTQLCNKVKTLTVPNHSFLVSFGVTNMIRIGNLKYRLQLFSQRKINYKVNTRTTEDIDFFNNCISETCFQFNYNFYRQEDGLVTCIL